MNRRIALALCCAGVLNVPVFAAYEAKVPACCAKKATEKSAAETRSTKMRCTLTGKEIDTCCCEKREGKLYCPLAKKNVDKCCCEEVKDSDA